ncbi:Uncharacterised protein [Vibrio cholerae]|nr:Uncharacterised protein [Vibrio cholerae]
MTECNSGNCCMAWRRRAKSRGRAERSARRARIRSISPICLSTGCSSPYKAVSLSSVIASKR